MTRHLLLIDASGIAFRAFATSDPVHRESDGEPIGAALRFAEITWKLLGDAQADPFSHGCAVFDIPRKTFRHELYPAYKSNRDPARRLILDGQLPYMKHMAETMGLFPIEAEGFEADDVIASLALRFEGRVTIVSSDKDFGQLVKDGRIEIVDPMANKRIGEKEVVDRWGVTPKYVVSVQALAGDPVDGYPGLKHCGLERAAGLIRAYGSIDGVFKNRDRIPYPALKHALAHPKAKEQVEIFRKLAALRWDVPLHPQIWEMCETKPVMESHLAAILKAMKAPPWAMQAVFHMKQSTAREVPALADPMAWWSEELKFPGQRLTDIPQCGCYKRRLVRGGPEVPAVIWAEPCAKPGHVILKCEVGGKARDPFEEWPRLSMTPITKAEYVGMMKALDNVKPAPTYPSDIASAPKSTNPRSRRKA
jgi:DNA polymerase-1